MPMELKAPAPERQARPKAVIFDIGRVIVRLNLSRAFAPITTGMRDNDGSAQRLSPEGVWKMICQDERWPDWQEGRLSPREWHEHLMRRLKLSLTYAQFREAWNLVLDPQTILSDELFAKLSGCCLAGAALQYRSSPRGGARRALHVRPPFPCTNLFLQRGHEQTFPDHLPGHPRRVGGFRLGGVVCG